MSLVLHRPAASHYHVPRRHTATAVAPDVSPADLQSIWAASQDADDPASRPRGGWWSIMDWATATHILEANGSPFGFAAVRAAVSDDVAEGRLALLPGQRSQHAGQQLVQTALDLAQGAGAARLRLVAPAAARWAGDAARPLGFAAVRASLVMLRPSPLGPLPAPAVPAVRVRPIRSGEEPMLLESLNRAWASTWEFAPIPSAALARDLEGQRDGMLVAVEAADDSRIVATAHAIFDPTARNLDGDPYAWISNLTTDPDWRGRGLGRLMLARGIRSLHERGAGSVMLGVDGGNAAAVGLYRSAGFQPVSTTDILERLVRIGGIGR